MRLIGGAMALLGIILFATVGYGTRTIGFDGVSTELHWGKIVGFGALIAVGGLLVKYGEASGD